MPQPAPTPAAQPTRTGELRLTARGRVAPVQQARIGTISGGVITSLSTQVGAAVGEQQEIARVRGATDTEVLVAPWRGVVTGIPVNNGDTVVPGTTLVTIADLSRLQVETTDVDEFIISGIRPGQTVTMTTTQGIQPAGADSEK